MRAKSILQVRARIRTGGVSVLGNVGVGHLALPLVGISRSIACRFLAVGAGFRRGGRVVFWSLRLDSHHHVSFKGNALFPGLSPPLHLPLLIHIVLTLAVGIGQLSTVTFRLYAALILLALNLGGPRILATFGRGRLRYGFLLSWDVASRCLALHGLPPSFNEVVSPYAVLTTRYGFLRYEGLWFFVESRRLTSASLVRRCSQASSLRRGRPCSLCLWS